MSRSAPARVAARTVVAGVEPVWGVASEDPAVSEAMGSGGPAAAAVGSVGSGVPVVSEVLGSRAPVVAVAG